MNSETTMSPTQLHKPRSMYKMQATCRACNNPNKTYLHNPVKIILQALNIGGHLLHGCRRHHAVLQLHLHLLHDLQTPSAASCKQVQCCIAILA